MDLNQYNQIIKDISQNELSHFYDLYQKYHGMVRAVLFRMYLADSLDDGVQEVFVRVWKFLPTYKKESSLKTWIYKITYHVALDIKKKQQKSSHPFWQNKIDVSDSENSHSSQDSIHKALALLTTEDRGILVLFSFENLSLKEIADVFKIPEGTVKSKLHYAKKQVAEFLKQQGLNL